MDNSQGEGRGATSKMKIAIYFFICCCVNVRLCKYVTNCRQQALGRVAFSHANGNVLRHGFERDLLSRSACPCELLNDAECDGSNPITLCL